MYIDPILWALALQVQYTDTAFPSSQSFSFGEEKKKMTIKFY